MDVLIGEAVAVVKSADSPRPVRFTWRGEAHEVAQVFREWIDVGHGNLPERSRRWYTRRHRRYFLVKDVAGATFELYLDYSNRERPAWFLARKMGGPSAHEQ